MDDETKERLEASGMSFGEFAEQERARIIADYRANGHPTASEREALADFVAFARNFQEWVKSDEAAQMKEDFEIMLGATRDALEAIRIEIEADDELASMSLDEALESGRLEVLIDYDTPLGIPDDEETDTEATAITTPSKQPTARAAAIERGAVMSLDGHVTAYSHKELQHALDGFSLFRLPTGTDEKEAFGNDGRVNDSLKTALSLGQVSPLRLTKYQAGFFYAVNRIFDLYDTSSDGDREKVEVYIPGILRDMGIDARAYRKKQRDESGKAIETPASERRVKGDPKEQRRDAILALAAPFAGVYGKAPNGDLFQVLSIGTYRDASETIVISSPFLAELRHIADSKKHPLHRYLHSSVVNEKNQAAVELANQIIIGVVQRGYHRLASDRPVKKRTVEHTGKDGAKTKTVYEYDDMDDKTHAPVVYRVQYQTLIDKCPLLLDELKEAKSVNAYNRKLQLTFEAAFRIIETKSDLPKHYKNLSLPMVRRTRGGKKVMCYESPTKSTTRRNLIITHDGRP